MKNLKYITFILLVALLQSCDPDKVDDDFLADVKVYSEFGRSNLTLPVLDGEANTASVAVKVSTPTNTSGLTLNVLPKSDAVEGTDFTLDTSDLSFSDGEIEGILLIQGIFEAASLDGKSLFLELQSTDENVVVQGNTILEVRIEKQCPVSSDYLVGEYTISDVQATIGPGNGVNNFAGTVNIEIGSSATARVFDVAFLAGFGTSPAQIELSLICGNLFFNTTNTVPLACDGVNLIGYSPNPNAEMVYSEDDDSSFVISYTEDQNGSCGGPFESSFRLTKVQ